MATAVAEAHRDEWAQVLASTVRVAHDLDLAEEAVQDAYVQALTAWAGGGVPERPGAWLTTAARRNVLSALRRQRTLATKLPMLVVPEEAPGDGETDDGERWWDVDGDDRLRLVFTCCHPALSTEARIALTLRLVCGMATPEVARALLVAETTMAARITRAKRKITLAGIPYAVPRPEELPARLDAVLTVIHLLYTTGHTAPAGDELRRDDLADRALGLARMLRALLPREPEVAGLEALLLVHHARRDTRTDAEGRLIRLAEQDRGRWDRTKIGAADRLITASLTTAAPGRFTLQAAIAALHAEAPTYAATDWPQILAIYDRLLGIWPSPVVALNRAVAVSMATGPREALRIVEQLEQDPALATYPYLPATKAELLHRLGETDRAVAAWTTARDLTANEAERAFLTDRINAAG